MFIAVLIFTGLRAACEPSFLIIGHRGASGHRPEHTIEAYTLAIEQGAHYIEPDLVATKDGHLIARHENEISQTTDVKEKFPSRLKTKTIDGENITGWFTEDFTLAEIKTLKARERLPSRSNKFDNQFRIPTFDEVAELAKKKGVGIYPEMKHPSYFRSIGLELEKKLAAALKKHKLENKEAKVFVQSFELESLKKFAELSPNIRRILLVHDQKSLPKPLSSLKGVVYGIGPNKRLIIPEVDGKLGTPTDLVKEAHAAGLKVHPYTFRGDPPFLHPVYKGNPAAEYLEFKKLGVDGVFTDFPDQAK